MITFGIILILFGLAIAFKVCYSFFNKKGYSVIWGAYNLITMAVILVVSGFILLSGH